MTAIVTGNGTGLERSSAWVLGSAGELGSAKLGRGNDNVYVNAANGNLVIDRKDEILVGRGPDEVWGVTYNSQDASTLGGTSMTWQMSSYHRIVDITGTVNTAGSTATRVAADGSACIYTYDATRGCYLSREGAGAYDELRFAGSVWTWTDGDSRATEQYGLIGGNYFLTSAADADGNTQSYTYDSVGRLTRITNANGDYTDFAWANGSRPSQLTTTYTNPSSGLSSLTRVRYAWDSQNRLTGATVDLSPEDSSVTDGRTYVTSYTYDGTSMRVASISQSDGSLLQIGYTLVGADYRVSTLTQTVASGVTRVTNFSYNTATRTTTITDPAGNVTSLSYDAANQLTQITYPPDGTGASAQTMRFTYNGNGDLIAQTDGNYRTTTYTYDANGNLLTTQDPLGNVVVRTYGSKNELLTETRWLVSPSAGSNDSLEAPEVAAGYAYVPSVADATFTNAAGVAGNGSAWGFAPAPGGDQVGFIQGGPSTISLPVTGLIPGVTYTVSFFLVQRPGYGANPITIIFNGAALGTFTPSSTAFERYTASFTAGAGTGTLTFGSVYSGVDVASGLDLVRLLPGAVTGGPAVTTRYAYDSENHLRFVVDPEGEVTEFVYDTPGQLVSTIGYPANAYNVGGLASNVSIGESTLAGWVGSIADRSNVRRSDTSYDSRGNVATVTSYSAANSAGAGLTTSDYSRATYIYDPEGNLLSRQTNASSASEVFVYDGLGRMIGSTDMAGGTTTIAFTDASGTTTATYADGRTHSSVYNRAGELIAEIDGDSNLLPNSYLLNGTDGWNVGNANRVAAPPGGTVPYYFQHAGGAGNGYTGTGLMPVPAASTVYFSFQAKPAVAGQQIQAAIYWIDANGIFITQNIIDRFPTDTANFTTYEFQGTKPANAATYQVYIQSVGGTWGAPRLAATPLSDASLVPPVTTYRYDTLGRVRIVTDPTGRTSHVLYDNAGRKVADIAADGSIVEYGYDSGDRLVRTIRYLNKLTSGQLASLVDANGNPANVGLASVRPAASANDGWTWNVYDVADQLIETIDAAGSATTFSYDGDSRLVSTVSYANAIAAATVTDFKTTSPTALVLPTASGTDRLTRSFYDNDGRVVAVLDGSGGLSQTFYDEAGKKLRQIGYANAAAAGLRAAGTLAQLLASVGTSAADRRTDFVYDGRGLIRYTVALASATEPAAHPAEFVYDAAGNVIRTVDYAGSIASAASYSLAYVQAQLSATGLSGNADNRISRSVYDAAGRLAFSIDATGTVSAFVYDSVGRVVKETGYATIYTVAGDQSMATMQSWASSHAADAGNRVGRSVYDLLGRVAYTVDAEGYVTEHQYDEAGRVTKDIVYPASYSVADGATKASLAAQIGSLPAAAVVTTYAYDAAGRRSDVTDGNGVVTRFAYDALGQVVDTIAAFNTADAATVHRAYDAGGRVVSETAAYGTADASTSSYGYDALGNRTTVTDARGYVATYGYDSLGRVLSARVPVDANAANDLVTASEYDAFGNLAKLTDARGNATFSYYDSLGRLSLEVDREGYATKTLYTAFGQPASVTRYAARTTGTPTVTTPPTIVTTSGVDAATSFTYDRLGRLLTTTDAEGYYEQYVLNAFGDRVTVRNRLGGITANSFDRRGELTAETMTFIAGRLGGSFTTAAANKFEYDSRGNRTRLIEAFGLPEQRTTNFIYDKDDRLIQVTHDQVQAYVADLSSWSWVVPTEAYSYDLRGNLIQTVDAGGGKSLCWYDAQNRKIAELNPVGTLSRMTYDGNGNLLSQRAYADPVAIPGTPGGTPPAGSGAYRETLFAYDRANRLTSSSVAGLLTGEYAGGAYATATGTVSTLRVYDKGGNLIKETDGRGNISWSWYDKLGNKTAQVDRENFLTVWERNGDGNATLETRYATRITGAFSEATSVGGLQSLAGTSGADRATTFSYDRNGRRTYEVRLYTYAKTLDGNGALVDAGAHSVVQYLYNGLGQVWQKSEANGDSIQTSYDNFGRQIWAQTAAYGDFEGASVRDYSDTYYNGLGQVSTTVQRGKIGADDRTTTYAYGAGGRLASITDASGFVRNFAYDAAGRTVAETYTRTRSDGVTTAIEGTNYRYDLAGRLVTQAAMAWNGAAWIGGEATRIRYDGFGEVTGRGLTGSPADAAVYQETFDYDSGGRLWRSTAGDGAVKLMFYDRGGNLTLALSSAGADLSAQTQASAATTINSAGGTTIANAVTTIATFDKRGQQLQTREPDRQLSSNGAGGFNTAALVSGRVYNAFGEVASETDARGYTTDYGYNAMGRLIQKQSPTVSWTSESGAVSSARPTENYYYDSAGRLIGVRDSNNNLTTRALLAGTGYGGAEAKVSAEYHADGGVARTYYDIFGDARIQRNELFAGANSNDSDERLAYDKMGRVVSVVHRGGLLTDYYAYDGLGQRTQHWNSLFGASYKERTDYDVKGRVAAQSDMVGGTTTYSYGWNGALATAGLGTFGGWVKTTVNGSSLTATDTLDYFGRTIGRTDFGGHAFSYSYDAAGRLASESGPSGQSMVNIWMNTGLLHQVADTAGTGKNAITATYGYDATGNRIYEGYAGTVYSFYFPSGTTASGLTLQNATFAYDALGRVTSFIDRDAAGTARITVNTEYDLAGNVRRVQSTYPNLAYPQYGSVPDDKWYRYDSMNRMVLADGTLSNGQIVRTWGASEITYDAAGRRATQTKDAALTGYATTWVWYPDYDPNGPGWHNFAPMEPGVTGDYQYMPANYMGARQEQYSYRPDGELSTVSFAETGYTDNGDGTVSSDGTLGAAVLRGEYQRDAMGRISRYREFDTDGATVTYDRYNISYANQTLITAESVSQRKTESGGNHTYVTNTVNSYTNNRLTSTTGDLWKDGSDSAIPDTSTTFSYIWYDDARVSSSSYDGDTGSSSNPIFTSTYAYDGIGRLASVDIADGRRRTVSFAYTPEGLVLSRKERSAASTNPEDQHYFLSGMQVGELTSNGNNDPETIDYGQTLVTRNWTNNPTAAPFRWNTSGGVTYGRFGPTAGYDAINPMGDGAQATDGQYVARGGESLQDIARNAWGDGSLWYLIAQANGMSGAETLVAGQSLILPDRVHNVHNNANTFKVYDPNRAIGDLSPTTPKPPKKDGHCGIVGQILSVVVAVAAARLFGPILGNVVSQGFNNLIGLQHGFSWKSLAISTISAALTPPGTGNLIADVALNVAANVATQGIAVATGLQDKFDWAGVAASGVGSAVGAAAGASGFGGRQLNGIFSNAVGGFAQAATRSLITGTSFGDNILAVLPDVIGSTLGNWIADRVQGSGGSDMEEEANAYPGANAYDGDGIVETWEFGDASNSTLTPFAFEGAGPAGTGASAPAATVPSVGTHVPVANYRSVLGAGAANLLDLSPEFRSDLAGIAAGYSIEVGAAGGGTYTNTTRHIIYIDQSWLGGDVQRLVLAMGHEVGHAGHHVTDDLTGRENYIKVRMRDEGYAVWNSLKIASEINSARPGALNLTGYAQYTAIYTANQAMGSNPTTAALDQIGTLYQNEHPSSAPAKTYHQFYSDAYDAERNNIIANNHIITSNNARIGTYNNSVDKYNAQIQRTNAQRAEQNQRTRDYNRQVDQANSRRPPGAAPLPHNPILPMTPLQRHQSPQPLIPVPPA
jgi:YD repeat-containing protein